VAAVRQELGWNHAPFEIPDDIYAAWDAREQGAAAEAEWQQRLDAFRAAHGERAAEFERRLSGALPDNWADRTAAEIAELQARGGDMATRKASQVALNTFGPLLPELIGGSADLAGSNNTIWSGSVDVLDGTDAGNYVYFGVREFGMAAICNGIALHGGFVPYNATFLVFSDYARNAVRMSALMGAHNIHVYTHDSIGLGEDGPTHQPVEHVSSLRLIPGLSVWRPCDAVESAVAWKCALEERDGPHALIFTRQNLPHQARNAKAVSQIENGGYVLRDTPGTPDLLLIATGSEVSLATAAAEELAESGVAARVVSMPNPDRFLAQDPAFREAVLPADVTARVAIEAGVTHCWHRLVGDRGRVVGIDRFGASAPASELFEQFGITTRDVVATARTVLNNH
jgi:transketolase